MILKQLRDGAIHRHVSWLQNHFSEVRTKTVPAQLMLTIQKNLVTN